MSEAIDTADMTQGLCVQTHFQGLASKLQLAVQAIASG